MGDTPVVMVCKVDDSTPSIAGHVKPCENPGGPPPKTKYTTSPIANEYREGTVKSTPGGE